MTVVSWKHYRGRSSYSEISFNTFVTEEAYSCAMLKNDLEKAGVRIIDSQFIKMNGSCEFSCVLNSREFSVGMEEGWHGYGCRIIFEADLLTMRLVMEALGIREDECS